MQYHAHFNALRGLSIKIRQELGGTSLPVFVFSNG